MTAECSDECAGGPSTPAASWMALDRLLDDIQVSPLDGSGGLDAVGHVLTATALVPASASALCPELVRALRREIAEMDARSGAMQRSRGTLASYLD